MPQLLQLTQQCIGHAAEKTRIRKNGIQKPVRHSIFRQYTHQLSRILTEQHRLIEPGILQFINGQFADFVFGWDYDMFGDGSKLRRAGFNGYQAADQMFFTLFAELRAARFIP